MDRLEEIFYMQKALNQDIRARRGLTGTREEWIQRQALALYVEMGEMLNEVNYKWWKNPKPVDEEALKGELVDVFHFFISMCLEAGLDAESLHKAYLDKNQVNFLRQQGKTDKEGYDVREMER